MEFKREDDGSLLAIADDEERLLAIFLQSDIQDDLVVGKEISAMIEKVIQEKYVNYEAIGNACQLTLSKSQACIKPLLETGSENAEVELFCLPLAAFSRALNDWLSFAGTTGEAS